MSTQIQFQSFNFQSSAVRVITDPTGEFWFCGKDVCTILGYVNESLTLQKHCKENGVSKRYLIDKMQRKQEAIFINEPNLYRLIIKSRKPEAEPFEAWVFEEVLPQIRKTGQYSQNSQQNLPLTEPKPDIVLSYDDAYWIAKYLVRAKAFGKEVEVFQRQLFETIGLPRYAGRNDLAAKGYDLAHEFNHKLDPFIEQIFPQTAKVKRLVHTNF